jgi:hypothetical protein
MIQYSERTGFTTDNMQIILETDYLGQRYSY